MAKGGLASVGVDATVACIGETMALLVPPKGDPIEYGVPLMISLGGAESNVAMYLVDLGHRAQWVSRLGDDSLGQIVLDYVRSTGVDVSAVELDPTRPTGLYIKEPGPRGTRVRYYRRGSAASAMGVSCLDRVGQAGLLHLTGITPALSDTCRELVFAALTQSQRTGRPVSFDVNWRPSLWSGEAPDLLRSIADRSTIVFVGVDEAAGLWGCSSPRDVKRLLPSPPILVVKDGGNGATVFVDDQVHFVPALTANVVEPIGAGDAFAAGFLSGLLRGFDPVRQARLGHLTAVAALQVEGDHGPLVAPHLQAELLDADEAQWSCAEIRPGSFVRTGGG